MINRGRKALFAFGRTILFGGVFAALVYVLQRLLSGLLPRAAESAGSSPVSVITGETALLVPILIATALMALLEKRSVWSYGLRDTYWWRRLIVGAVAGFAILSLLIGLLAVTGHIVFDGVALTRANALRFGAEWAFACLLIGMVEELLFRGYVQQTLARGIGFWPAAVLLSTVFGALHLGNSGEEAFGAVGAVLGGLVFCYSLWRASSLWWAIGAHGAWDWAESYFYGTSDSGTTSVGHLLTSHPAGASWMSGGSVGPEGSIFVIVALVALVATVRWTLRPAPDGNAGGLPGDRERPDEGPRGQVDGVDGARIGAD